MTTTNGATNVSTADWQTAVDRQDGHAKGKASWSFGPASETGTRNIKSTLAPERQCEGSVLTIDPDKHSVSGTGIMSLWKTKLVHHHSQEQGIINDRAQQCRN